MCFSLQAFTKTGNGIEVHADPECGGNRLVIMSEVMNVVLHTPSGKHYRRYSRSLKSPSHA